MIDYDEVDYEIQTPGAYDPGVESARRTLEVTVQFADAAYKIVAIDGLDPKAFTQAFYFAVKEEVLSIYLSDICRTFNNLFRGGRSNE